MYLENPINKDIYIKIKNMKTLQNYIDSVVNKVLRESLDERADEIINKLNSNVNEEDDDMEGFDEINLTEGETCEQCGGSMNEGECSECGYMRESIYESDFDPSDKLKKVCDEDSDQYDKQSCAAHKKYAGSEMTEALYGEKKKSETKEGKKFPDLSGDGKVTRKDVLMGRGVKLNGKKSETKEGKKFPDLSGDGKVTRKDVLMGRGVKLKESIQLTEDEMIDLIEKIVNEQKSNITKQSNPPGVSTTKRNLDKSKKENDDYIKSVTKKMKEYLKDGSKGDFDFEPKIFPKGNGELAKMDKKTYKPTSEVEEYIENFSAAGLENLVYDEIHPNEEKMDEYMEGSSKAGNNPKWANAVETDVNKRRNKVRKNNYLGILKKKESFNKQPQPVYDSKKDDEKEKNVARIFQALESTEDKKQNLIKEEMDKMNKLLNYNKKTQ
jgi:hypothetical protein